MQLVKYMHFNRTLCGIVRQTLIILLTFTISHFVLADTCYTTFEKDSADADIIFVGKLIEANYGVYWEGGSPTSIYTFEILESFKGLSKWRTVTSIMSPVNGCCSPHFKMDSTFLVFAFAFGDGRTAYWTNDCTLTGLLNEPETQEYYARLGEPHKPEVSSDDLELFNERKAWLLGQELKKTDSINQLHNNLQMNIANQQRSNNYLIIALVVMGLLTTVLLIAKISKKKST